MIDTNEHGGRCYIYTRVSTAIQVDGYSLEAQEDKIRKYAEFKDLEVIRLYSDRGKSGKSTVGRTEFIRMIQDIESEKDKITHVLVFKLSRFGRNALDVMKTLEVLETHKVALVAVEDGIDSSNGAGKLIVSVIAAVSEMERKNINEQTQAGRRQKAKEGKWNGGQAPIGYKVNSQTGILEIDEEYADVVRMIFDKFVNTDLGYTGISNLLVKQGIDKRRYKENELSYFSVHTIKKIIDNPTYCGKIAYGRTRQETVGKTQHRVKADDYEMYEGLHEPIISEELFNKAQEKRRHTGIQRERNPNYDTVHLLSNVLVCPVCGGHMAGHTTQKKKPDGTFYAPYTAYECKKRRNVDGKPCTYKHIWNEKVLDAAVAEAIGTVIHNDRFIEKMGERICSQVDRTEIEKEVECEKNNLDNLEAKLRYYIAQQDKVSLTDKSYERKMDDLQAKIDSIYEKIADAEETLSEAELRLDNLEKELINLNNVYGILERFDELYAKCSLEDKKDIINALIERVEIYPEKTSDGQVIKAIAFKFPVFVDGEEGKEVFLSKGNNVETVVRLSRGGENS